jgi:hypothetical protein
VAEEGQAAMGGRWRLEARGRPRKDGQPRADEGGWPEEVRAAKDGHTTVGLGIRVGVGMMSVVGVQRRRQLEGGGHRRTDAAVGRLRAEEDGHHRSPRRRRRASLKGGGEAGHRRPSAW